ARPGFRGSAPGCWTLPPRRWSRRRLAAPEKPPPRRQASYVHPYSCGFLLRDAIALDKLRRRARFPHKGDIAADDHVGVARIDLQSDAAAAGPLGRDERRAATEERVEHGLAGAARIAQGSFGQLNRLLRRMHVALGGIAVNLPERGLVGRAEPAMGS